MTWASPLERKVDGARRDDKAFAYTCTLLSTQVLDDEVIRSSYNRKEMS